MQLKDPNLLLAQVPLTVSPNLSLPAATTLPYTYKTLPSTLPPSVIDAPNPAAQPNPSKDNKPQYVISASGHTAHPNAIIKSCEALQAHIQKTEREATELVRKWERDIKERELAEKRRVAPGWLDSDERILVPDQTGKSIADDLLSGDNISSGNGNESAVKLIPGSNNPEGEELDRAFGGLGVS